MEAGLPNFWEQKGASGYPAATLPFKESAANRAAKPPSFSAGGLYGWPFWVSTPENDKTDKNRQPVLSRPQPAAQRAFLLAAHEPQMDAVKPKSNCARRQFGIACPKLAAFGWDHISALRV